MPSKLIEEQISNKEPGFEVVREIAEKFNVSLTAAAHRLIDLTDLKVALIASEERKIKYFRISTEFNYFLDTGFAPDTYITNPSRCLSLPTEFMTVDSSNWLNGRQPESGEILEWSIKLGNYPTTLTLLWLDE